jgi:hypothetical protein
MKDEKIWFKRWKRMIKKYGAKSVSGLFPGIVSDFAAEDLIEYDVEVYNAIHQTMHNKKSRLVTLQEIAETFGEDSMARLSTAIMYLQSIRVEIDDEIQSNIYPEQVLSFKYQGSVLPFLWARPTEDEKYLCISIVPDLSNEKQGLLAQEYFDVMDELWRFIEQRHTKDYEFGFAYMGKFMDRYYPHIHFSLKPSQSDIAFYEKLEQIDEEGDER